MTRVQWAQWHTVIDTGTVISTTVVDTGTGTLIDSTVIDTVTVIDSSL